MADSFLPYQNPTTTDAKLDSEQLVVGANTVERERVQIAGDSATDIAPVTAADGLLVNLGTNNDVTVTGTVTATGPLTDTELRATPVPVSGTVSVTEPVSIDDNGGSITVDGAVTVSGTVSVTEPVSIDDNGGSITVDGAVTVSATDLDIRNLVFATDTVDVSGSSVTVSATNLDIRDLSHTQDSVKIGDGTDIADVLDLANSNPLTVAIVDGSGDQITSFGGGTQYAEDTAHVSGDTLTLAGVVQQTADAALSSDGDRSLLQVDASGFLKVNVKAGSTSGVQYTEGDTDTTITGTAIMFESNTGTSALSVVNNTTPLPVSDAGGTLTVDGTVTATPPKSATATLSNVSSSASSVTLLSSNANRFGATIFNDSTKLLYVKFGTTASSTDYTVQMASKSYYEVPFQYTGRIDGIWASANGAARITELTT